MYDLTLVKWIDSGFSLRSDIWQTKEEIQNLLEYSKEVYTVGYNIYEDDKWLVLIQSLNQVDLLAENDLFRGGYFIYKPCIVERNIL